jgi:hypothetical protein
MASKDDYIRGGKGRRDEVGRSGIYPASLPDAPPDSAVRSEGELVSHRSPHRPRTDRETEPTDASKEDQCLGSE